MGQAGDEHALEVGHDGAEGLGFLRRLEREGCRDLPWSDLGQHRVALGVLQVLGDPVHELVPVAPEALRRPSWRRRRYPEWLFA